MRIPRSLVLSPGSAFHLWWRGHNKEFVLESPTEKLRYIGFLSRSLDKIRSRLEDPADSAVRLFSYCLMSNHAHGSGQISSQATSLVGLSRLFQIAHSTFGRWYNRLHNRSGKVAEERFKTRLVQDDDALQVVMAYGDANPVKAGLVKHPKDYRWSSYRFYAYGEKVPGWELLTPPAWYLELGKDPGTRQRRYREIVDAYLRHSGLLHDQEHPKGHFVGSAAFVARRVEELRAALKRRRSTAGGVPP